MEHSTKRDSWGSKWGFILACIGSAVGMGNIWLFPARVSAYGGATFLIPYLIFVVIIGSTGVIGEMSFGRATRSGPIHAFGYATKDRWGTEKPGKLLGLVPVIGSLALAIGYSVVVGWIFKYLYLSFSGQLMAMDSVDAFSGLFGATAISNPVWQILGMAVTIVIMAFGIGQGIEKANKVMMPLFFLLFIGLGVYICTLPGASDAYAYIFVLDPQGLKDPMVWVYALGQAFFSLSVAGNGTLIYGSYLSKDSNVPADAKMVAVFDTCAAMLAALVILPAMAVAGQELTGGGPGLMFIFLPNVLRMIPGGSVILVVFFVAVVFAALTSLVNLYEAPTATLQELFHLKRHGGCQHRRHRHCGGPHHRPQCLPLDGRVLHLHLPPGRHAGGHYVLLGLQEGVCAGAGEPRPQQAPWQVVLPHGEVRVLRCHHPGTDPGCLHRGRYRLIY